MHAARIVAAVCRGCSRNAAQLLTSYHRAGRTPLLCDDIVAPRSIAMRHRLGACRAQAHTTHTCACVCAGAYAEHIDASCRMAMRGARTHAHEHVCARAHTHSRRGTRGAHPRGVARHHFAITIVVARGRSRPSATLVVVRTPPHGMCRTEARCWPAPGKARRVLALPQ